MHEDEQSRPRLIALLTLLVPIGVAVCFGGVEYVAAPAAHPVSGLWMRAAAGALLAMIPAAAYAARRQAPGQVMFLLALLPVLLTAVIPLARYNGLLSPIWQADAVASEAAASLHRTWLAVGRGAWVSAQASVSFVIASALWPSAPARGASPWFGPGRQRAALFVASPLAVLLAALCWRLAGLAVLPADILTWAVVGLPSLVLALGPSAPRRAREILLLVVGSVACVLLLTLSAQGARLSEAMGRTVTDAATLSYLPREILVRWFVAGIVAAFSVLALLPGHVRVRRPRVLRLAMALPAAAGLLVPVFAALAPGWPVMRDVRSARASWHALLATRNIRLPACSDDMAALTPGPLLVVPLKGPPVSLTAPGSMVNVAASADMPVEEAFTALVRVPSGATVEFLVGGCDAAASPEAVFAGLGQPCGSQRGVPLKLVRKLDCPGQGETVQVLLQAGRARVLRNACAAAPPAPSLSDIPSVRASSVGKTLVLSAADGTSLEAFLVASRQLGEAVAVNPESEAVRARMDQAATREMLVPPGKGGIWRGALAVLSAEGSAGAIPNPEAVHGPVRGAFGLYQCFAHVSTELRFTLAAELGEDGSVRSSGVEGEGTAGLAECVAAQARAMTFPEAVGTSRIEVKGAWYPAALRVPEGMVASGALAVRAESDGPQLRGGDVLTARLAPYIARCLAEGLQNDAELSGTTTLRACVTPSGVLEPSGADSNRIPREALECVRDAVKLVRPEPQQVPARDPACFRIVAELANSVPSRAYQLEMSVQEPEHEALRKRDGADSENTARARALGPEVMSCFGARVRETGGELVLSLHPNRWGRVLSVSVETKGAIDARFTRCAVEAASRMQVHVDPEAHEVVPKFVITMKVADEAAL